METQVYNQEGKAADKVQLPEAIFGLERNDDLVHQVVVGFEANKRTSVAHTKDRSEVRGGGKKPWKQKGTGRARVGSIRSPLWRGGGITFGPRKEKNYSKKINKKMKSKALYITLSQKLRDEEILFVDTLSFSESKTAQAKAVLIALSSIKGFSTLVSKKNNSVLIALNEKDSVIEKSFNNMSNIEVGEVRNLNARDVLLYKHIIIVKPKDAISFFNTKIRVASESTKVEKKDVESHVKKAVTKKTSTAKVARKVVRK